MENNQENLLREIANDRLTPKKKKTVNTDGLFETTDCSDLDRINTGNSEQITLNEF